MDQPTPETLAAALLDGHPDFAFAKDTAGRYIYVNESLARALSKPRSEILGRTDADLLPPSSLERLRQVDGRVLAGEIVEETETWPLQGEPSHKHTLRAPLRGEDGAVVGIIGIMRDVTASAVMAEAQRELEQRLLQTQKMESLAVMAAGIAHDFNNLLAAVLGNAELALQMVPSGSSAHDCLTDISAAARRATELSHHMLAFSGAGPMSAVDIQLSNEIEALRPLIESTISRKANLVMELSGSLPPVNGDISQIRQLLLNLVTNASEALPEGRGTILVRTDVAYWDQLALASTYVDDKLPAGEYVQLEVTDDGIGMDAETSAKLFEPFFSQKFTGRGLGLAAVLGIARGHKGAVQASSEPGKGTTVTVILPAAKPPPLAPQRQRPRRLRLATPSGPNLAVGGHTILVVDDEPSVLTVAQRLLSNVGYTVLTAVDGEAALEVLADHGDQVDLVLLDLTMPRLDGNETYARLREDHPDLPVILCSGYSPNEVDRRFQGSGLAGFVQKPYHPVRLIQKVQSAIKARRS